MVSNDNATQIAENVIEHDFSKNSKVMCTILINLPYLITEENSNIFDDFLLYFQENSLLDDIVTFCGNQKFFDKLPKTTEALISAVFEGEENDILFNRVIDYFTQPMIKKTFDKLKVRCVYKANNDYSRDLSIIRMIGGSKTIVENLEQLFNETIKPQLDSNYTRPEYVEFVSDVASVIINIASKNTIDAYIIILLNKVFANNQIGALEALKKISGSISADSFINVYNKIMTSCPASAFDIALDVIIDNNSVRPREQTDLDAYFEFLKKNLPTTTNPNRVLKILVTSFSKISSIDAVVAESFKNEAVSIDEVCHMVVHFLKAIDVQEDIARTIFSLYKTKNGCSVVQHAMSEMGDVSHILSALLPEQNKDEVLHLAQLAANYLSVPEGKNLLLKCLSTGSSEINLVEQTTEIIQIIIDHKQQLKEDSEFKAELAEITKEAFITIDSNMLREKILHLVNILKIGSIFKKGLQGESLEFFKKYT